jgi:hypothetical protein
MAPSRSSSTQRPAERRQLGVKMSDSHPNDQRQPLSSDLNAAKRFSDALRGIQHFQLFDDRGRNPRLARTLHGSLEELAPTLIRLNQEGAGIFAPVNEIVPGKPRRTENVVRVRTLLADSDDPAKLHEIEAAIEHFGLKPSIVVETSPGRCHFYWLTDDCPLDRFTEAQKALAAALGTDPAVCDLPRVARVPGFFHMKAAPFLVRLVSVS